MPQPLRYKIFYSSPGGLGGGGGNIDELPFFFFLNKFNGFGGGGGPPASAGLTVALSLFSTLAFLFLFFLNGFMAFNTSPGGGGGGGALCENALVANVSKPILNKHTVRRFT